MNSKCRSVDAIDGKSLLASVKHINKHSVLRGFSITLCSIYTGRQRLRMFVCSNHKTGCPGLSSFGSHTTFCDPFRRHCCWSLDIKGTPTFGCQAITKRNITDRIQFARSDKPTSSECRPALARPSGLPSSLAQPPRRPGDLTAQFGMFSEPGRLESVTIRSEPAPLAAWRALHHAPRHGRQAEAARPTGGERSAACTQPARHGYGTQLTEDRLIR